MFHPVVEGANSIPLRRTGHHRSDPPFKRRLRVQPLYLPAQSVFHGEGGRLSPKDLRGAPHSSRRVSRQPRVGRPRVHATVRRGAAPRSGVGGLPGGDAQGRGHRRTTPRRRDVPCRSHEGKDRAGRVSPAAKRAMPVGSKLPRFTKIHVVVGRPIDPPSGEGRISRSEISAKSEELRKELEAVYEESRQRLAR